MCHKLCHILDMDLIKPLTFKLLYRTMADLTLAQRFGTNANYNDTNKTLTIDLNDLTDAGDITDSLGLDISGITPANIDSYSAKILYMIAQRLAGSEIAILNFQQQPVDNNDETLPVYVTNVGRRSITRNGVAQFGYGLTLTAYQTDQIGNLIDPDNMV